MKRFNTLSAAQRLVVVLGPALVVLAMGFLAYGGIQRTSGGMERIVRAHGVSLTLDNLVERLLRAETAQRGYIITGEERFLEPYLGVQHDTRAQLDSLRTLILDPTQQERLRGLGPVAEAKLAHMESNVSLARTGDFDGAQASVRSGEGVRSMNAVRQIVGEMQEVQAQIIASRTLEAQSSARRMGLVVLFGALLAVVLAALTSLLLARHARAQEVLAQEVADRNARLREQARMLEASNDELRRAYEVLQQRDAEHTALLESAGDGIYGIDIKGRCTFINQRGAELLDYTVEEVLGQHMHDLIHHHKADGSEYPVAECPIYQAGEIGAGVRVEDELFWRKDGMPFAAEYASFPLLKDGRSAGAVVTFRDITDRKRLEEERLVLLERERNARREAEEANRAKMDFLSAMSHELRTPLNAISGYVDLMEIGVYGENSVERLQALDRIRSNQKGLLTLINDILQYAKLEAGRLEFHITNVPVAELLSASESMIEPQVQAAGLTYTVEGCDPELTVRGDPERVRQILLNLLTNAVKFTPVGGHVSLSCETRNERIEFHVRDTGRGIPAEMVQQVFDPFVQVERHRHESSKSGVGLGLAISRDLAHAMGGDLSVVSTPGKGSTFTLCLPATEREQSDAERRLGKDRRSGERRSTGQEEAGQEEEVAPA